MPVASGRPWCSPPRLPDPFQSPLPLPPPAHGKNATASRKQTVRATGADNRRFKLSNKKFTIRKTEAPCASNFRKKTKLRTLLTESSVQICRKQYSRNLRASCTIEFCKKPSLRISWAHGRVNCSKKSAWLNNVHRAHSFSQK